MRSSYETLDRRCEEAIAGAHAWIELNERRFHILPHCTAVRKFDERFKPLVELSLVCFLLTKRRHMERDTPRSRWGRQVACRLFDHVEWEGLIEMFRMHPSGTLGLVIYPLLALATGRTPRFLEEAKVLLEHPITSVQERSPMREMDYHFMRQLFDCADGCPPVSQQIDATVLKSQSDPLLLNTDALYDLTHVIFYATRFEIDPNAVPDPLRQWLRCQLGEMTLARLLMGDADLGAELLLNQLQLGMEVDDLMIECVVRLLGAAEPGGWIRGPAQSTTNGDEFDENYHTTLVGMVALTEFRLALRRQSP